MTLRASLSLVCLSLLFTACRGADPDASEQQLWSLGGASYGNPTPDAYLPTPDAYLPTPDAYLPPPDAGPSHDASPPHDGGHPHDGGLPWPFPDAAPPYPWNPPTIPYDGGTGRDTWWKDTDGVAPETAGCHIEYPANCAAAAAANARKFGESCTDDGKLVETNPEPHCHKHTGDLGHPYVIDCDLWCRGLQAITTDLFSYRRVNATRTGNCQITRNLPCNGGWVDSARCVCFN